MNQNKRDAPIQRISELDKRRFVLWQQGLLSEGFRWEGQLGVQQAIESLGILQVDWVRVLAPSHHLSLFSRVKDFDPVQLEDLVYGPNKKFIEYGGVVCIQPIENLPFLRHVMEEKKNEPRWIKFRLENKGLIAKVRKTVQELGSARKRDFKGTRIKNYRGRNDAGVALYYLWLTGELLTESRKGAEVVYAPFESIAPAKLQYAAEPHIALQKLLLQKISVRGMCNTSALRDKKTISDLIEQGDLVEVDVEGQPVHVIRASQEGALDSIRTAGRPKKKGGKRSISEVRLLSPLDMTVARGRAPEIFGTEFKWEIYKKPEKREYGPYTMPILSNDKMVGRIDARMVRESQSLIVNGLWLEPQSKMTKQISLAIASEIARLARFLSAKQVDVGAHLPHLGELSSFSD